MDIAKTVGTDCLQKWVDEFISWDPADYGGLETVRVATKSVWVPDVILINR